MRLQSSPTGADISATTWTACGLQSLILVVNSTGQFLPPAVVPVVFIDRVKKNPSFLAHIPSSLRYVRDALKRRPELREVEEILRKHVPELG